MGTKRRRERQTRLTFTPLPSSSPATKDYHEQIRSRAAAVSFDQSPKYKKRRTDESSDAIHQLNTPTATAPTAGDKADSDDADGATIDTAPGSAKSAKRDKRTQRKIDFSEARDKSSFDQRITLPSSSLATSSSRSGLFSSQAKAHSVESSSSDDELDVIKPAARTPAKRAVRSSQRPVIVDSDDQSDVAPKSSRKTRQARVRDDSPSETPQKHESNNSDGDSDLSLITPRQRRLRRSRKVTSEEQDDLDEDLKFLEPSSDAEETPRQPRTTQSVKKNARLEALAKLKRKRAGQSDPIEIDSDSSVEANNEDVEIGSDEIDAAYDVPMSSRQYFKETEDDEGFVIDEDDEPLGVREEVPIEFTHYARMKPKELFKYAVEWMVSKKVNPAFNKDDELYALSFRKLDDEVKGLAGSKFTSSAWTARFFLSLRARPDLEYEHFDAGSSESWGRDKCDACNRSGHPATYAVKFLGNPYHPATLEDVARNADDEDDDEDSDTASKSSKSSSQDDGTRPSYNADGREVAPANTVFFVGRFCMANAKTAHALEHWRYHLYDWVVTWLTRHGYNSSEEIVRRDKMSQKKRTKQVHKITKRMEKDGVMQTLWHDFKKNIDQARNSKQAGRFQDGLDSD